MSGRWNMPVTIVEMLLVALPDNVGPSIGGALETIGLDGADEAAHDSCCEYEDE